MLRNKAIQHLTLMLLGITVFTTCTILWFMDLGMASLGVISPFAGVIIAFWGLLNLLMLYRFTSRHWKAFFQLLNERFPTA